MLKDVVPFERVWLELHGSSSSARAVASFIRFLERRLGAEFIYDQAHSNYEPLELAGLLELAETLRARGIIRSYGRDPGLPDEPPLSHWYAEYKVAGSSKRAAGSTTGDQRLALAKTLAETVERNAWFTHDRFFPFYRGTVADVEKKGGALRPERFASYSDSQRRNIPRLALAPTDSFFWVRGRSWTTGRLVWIPAQIVSGHEKLKAFSPSSGEPVIRASITTGLATRPERTGALLAGALEVIERDAYIITWLNQLSPPRLDLAVLARESESLARLLARCRRYRLLPQVLRLPTDAPAYAVCAVLEDATGALPRFSVGLKADRAPALAAEGAVLEALRAHLGARKLKLSPPVTWTPETKATDIGQYERLLYWAEGDRGDRLAFLTRGAIQPREEAEWEHDTDEEHFERIVAWCRAKNYELASVHFADTRVGPSLWQTEFVVMPELQPLHYNEKLPYAGGERLQEIPRQFGYAAREPYLDDPHPFA